MGTVGLSDNPGGDELQDSAESLLAILQMPTPQTRGWVGTWTHFIARARLASRRQWIACRRRSIPPMTCGSPLFVSDNP